MGISCHSSGVVFKVLYATFTSKRDPRTVAKVTAGPVLTKVSQLRRHRVSVSS